MESYTESDLEDEVTEEVGQDVIVDSVNAKGTASKASTVWIYYEKTKEPKSGKNKNM